MAIGSADDWLKRYNNARTYGGSSYKVGGKRISGPQYRAGNFTGSNDVTVGLQVTGVVETVKWLKAFDDDLFQVMRREIREVLNKTRKGVQGRYPQGKWTTSVAVTGGKYKGALGIISTAAGSSKGFPSWGDAPGGAKAAIFDDLGRSQLSSPQAIATAASLTSKYGPPQRFLWRTWLENKAESEQEIYAAYGRAEAELQRRLNAVGG